MTVSQPRLWDDPAPEPNRLLRRVLAVYSPATGRPTMVGKILPVTLAGGTACALVHEESGTQHHNVTDAPGGIDAVVLAELARLRVPWVIHARKGGETLLATVRSIEVEGERRLDGGRERYFLPRAGWDVIDWPWNGAVPWVPGPPVVLRDQKETQ